MSQVKQGGVWKPPRVFVRQGGTWKAATEWVKQSGVWKSLSSTFSIPTPVNYSPNSVGGGSASIAFLPDGTGAYTDSGGGSINFNWGSPTTAGIGNSYWIKVLSGSGVGTWNGSTRDAWIQLSTYRSFGINSASYGHVTYKNTTYQIASDSAGVTVVAAGNLYISCDNS